MPPQTRKSKLPPSRPLAPSLSLNYYTLPLRPGKLLQCPVCLDLHAMCLLAPEAQRDRLKQVREKNLWAHQPESQHWSPWSQGSQSPGSGIAMACVFNTEERPWSADTPVGRIQAAWESKLTLGTSGEHTFPGTVSKLHLSSPDTLRRPNSGRSRAVRDE